jgi:hypothetical protein
MSAPDLTYFKLLKQKVAETFRITESGVPDSIENWKGNDIVLFQEDLEVKVKGRISEKWFYTHLKSDSSKLPRIDMLDMLSKYAGYSGWNNFKVSSSEKVPKSQLSKRKTFKPTLYISALLAATIIFISFKIFTPTTYNFCFVDSDLKDPILNSSIQIILLYPGESPVYTQTDESGCFLLKTNRTEVSFVVKAPYFKTDTITRILNKRFKNEHVHLNTNDYAVMIHFFSTSNIKDWKKRRMQLDNMIANNAQIYQVFEKENTGMEIYNKQEFINKLTMPVNSLKNIEIIETIYTGQKISTLRFYQKTN